MTDRPINATGGIAAASTSMSDAVSALPQEASVSDFVALLKPRVMSLVVFTGFAGMMIAPGSIHLELVPGAPTAVRDAVGIIANSALLLFHSSRPLPIRPTFPPLFE